MKNAPLLRWGLHQVRHGLYEPLELLFYLGIPAPRWLISVILAIDKPLLDALNPKTVVS